MPLVNCINPIIIKVKTNEQEDYIEIKKVP